MSDVIDVAVPDIGSFHDVPVIEVLVRTGDHVRKDDPIATLESEKATMEIPAPSEGVVADVAIKVGDKVSQGTLILKLSAPNGKPAAANGKAETPPAQETQAVATAPAPAAPHPATPVSSVPAPAREEAAAPTAAEGRPVHASPSLRRLAREFGVELDRIQGTGPNGRITREDVQAFVKRVLQEGPSPSSALGGLPLAPWPVIDFAQYGPIERKPLSRIKKISGPNLHRNWVMIPHVTNNDETDITQLEAFRREINAERPKDAVKVTLLAFLIKAAVAALQRFPEFNSSLDGDALVLKRYYSIGFAADTPNGLVVPVVKDAEKKGVLALADETAALAEKAREGKLGMSEMQGGTFTISSLGGIGGTSFTPIINAPEVAILGVSRSVMRPVWNGSAFEPRLMLPLSLSYDHRVIDGAAAARFNAFFATLLADLRRSLL